MKQVALHVFPPSLSWRRVILLHTCVINVVLNAMVKVNQAAILLLLQGSRVTSQYKQQNLFPPLQSIYTKVNKWEKKQQKSLLKTGINPSSLPGSPPPVAPRASKSVSKLSKR